MSSKSLGYKVLILLAAALVFNQLACSKASFDADKESKAQTAPAPESVEPFSDDGDDGFSDPTNTGGTTPTGTTPTYTYNPPTYTPPTYPPNDPSCEILSNTGKCYRNRYVGGFSRYGLVTTSGNYVRLNSVEIVHGNLNIQVFKDDVRVNNFDVSSDSQGRAIVQLNSNSSNNLRIEFCTY